MASRFGDAVSDDPEALGIIKQFRLLKASTALLLVGSVVAGFITMSGVVNDEYDFGNTRDGHIIFGTGLTFGLVAVAIIPTLFNRGKIQQAASVYNKNKR